MVLLHHPALSASNRLAAMNSVGTLLNRWHRESLFRVDGTVLTQFRMIRRGGGDQHHSADDRKDGAYRGAKEEATRRAKEEATRKAKEEAEKRMRKVKDDGSPQAKKAKEEEEERTRRAKERTMQLLREINAELRRFRKQSSLFPDNIKEAVNPDEKFKTFTRDFNKHLFLTKRFSAYELEPVLENYQYALRVFFASIGLVIFGILVVVAYRLLPRDDGIMPDHRVAQQSPIDFDQFVRDYLRAGMVQNVYVYPDKAIAIAVLQPGALIQGQRFNDDSGVLIRLDPLHTDGTNFLRVFEDVQNQIGTDLCNHVPATISKSSPSLKTKLFFFVFYGILFELLFKLRRAAKRRPFFKVKRRDGTAAKAQRK